MKTFLGIIVLQHLTDKKQMGLLRGQCARFMEGTLRCCCNLVWMKMVCVFHGMPQDLLFFWEETSWEAVRTTFKGPIIPFGAVVEYYPICAKDLSRLHQFGKKVMPGIFLGFALHAEGETWKGVIFVADAHEWWKNHIHRRQMEQSNSQETIWFWEHPP